MSESNETSEVKTNPREYLLKLQESDEYVFHGSSEEIQELKPQQATKYNHQTKKNEADGEPAVCATPYADIAIFRSIINQLTAKKLGIKHYYSNFGVKRNTPYFGTTNELLEHIANSNTIGYVHVLRKSDFVRVNDMEWRSEKLIIPLEIVEVHKSDPPSNIKLIKPPK